MSASNSVIEITAPAKKGKIQLPYATQIKFILNELALLVYKKRIDDCWGTPQNVRVADLKGKSIRVILPNKPNESEKPDKIPEDVQKTIQKHEDAISNIAKQVQEKGIGIAVFRYQD